MYVRNSEFCITVDAVTRTAGRFKAWLLAEPAIGQTSIVC